MTSSDSVCCPHCGAVMDKMTLPPEAGYDCEFVLVCFNDECPYYKDGWRWMWEKFQVRCSYRQRLNPLTNETGPLPVWSPSAMRDRIIP